jgi:hypothetical protein
MATRSSNDAGNSNSKDGEDLSELHLYRVDMRTMPQ